VTRAAMQVNASNDMDDTYPSLADHALVRSQRP
jgi:hypothetical protein